MEDLIPEFIDETLVGLDGLENDLVKLEANPAEAALIDNAFRVMHTIKGACGFMGLPRLEKVAHATENLLERFRSGGMAVSPRAMTVLLMGVDRVRYLATEIQKALREPDGDDADILAFIAEEVDAAKEQSGASKHVAKAVVEAAVANLEQAAPAPVPAPAAMPEPVVAAAPASEKPSDYMRVHVQVIEQLLSNASELVLTRNQLLQRLPQDDTLGIRQPFQHLCQLISQLQDQVMHARMQPIREVTGKLPRLVRDLSAELGKKIVLEVQGEETELDRQVLELVKDPLTHMLRNACDHGIELPAQRAARGKPEQGRIVVQARHEGGVVIVTVSDDGEGLDAGKIGAKAVEKGLVSAEQLARLSAREIRMFIMHPGFSTAKTVSHVSGRGVGMDVVRSNIEKIGGAIGMDSIPGQGTSFTLHIPLTLALIPALIFTICGQRYGMPQMNVQEVLALDTPSAPPVEWIQDTPVLRLRGQIIPLISAAMLFSLRRDAGRADVRPDSLVAVVTVGSHRYGLVLDAIHGSEEVVIKSIAPVLRNTLVFAGNTVLGDGRVVMILDPAAIARVFHIEADMHAAAPEPAPAGEHASMLVFRAGEGVAKALPLALVSRVQCIAPEAISRSGAQVLATLDGRMVPLVTVDGMAMPQHGEIMALMLADDRSESAMGLVIEAIIDTSESDLALSTVTARAGILGSMLLEDGRAVDVVDIAHFLVQQSQDWFSQHQHQHGDFAPEDVRGDVAAAPPIATHDASAGPARPVQKILLVDDSPFFRNMLHPILRTAGYDVSVCADPAQAIALHDQGAMFDVILSDIEMPGMDGYGFVARMRADSAWRNTPFIAITSHNTPADIAYGFKMGFDRYIGKFNREELLHAISHTQH